MVKNLIVFVWLLVNELLLGQGSLMIQPFSGASTAYPYLNAFSFNPSCTLIEHAQLGIAYNNRYILPELGTIALFGSAATLGGVSSAGGSYFGTSLYNHSSLTYTYARKLSSWLAAGVRMSFYTFRVQTLNQQASALTGEFGLQVFTPYDLVAGIHLINPNQSGYNAEYEKELPAECNLGIAWTQQEEYYFSAEVKYLNYETFSFQLGIEYWLIEKLALRAGSALASDSHYSFGLVTRCHSWLISLAFQRHLVLGISSNITLLFQLGKHE